MYRSMKSGFLSIAGLSRLVRGKYGPPVPIRNSDQATFVNSMALAAAITMAALVISVVPVRDAFAHNYGETEGCPSSERIATSVETSCLDYSYTNSPVAGVGFSGATYEMENLCPDYGDLRVNIDLISASDYHQHLNDGEEVTGGSAAKIRAITCCIEDSDLCLRQQVEKNSDGNISRWSGGLTFTNVDVSTHEARYTYCQEHPDDVYCEVDPEGDANTAPTCTAEGEDEIEGIPECPCGDGDTKDRLCTADDCQTEFADSSSLSSGTTIGGVTAYCAFSTDDWADFEASVDFSGLNCTIDTRCPTGSATWIDEDGNRVDDPIHRYSETSITDTIKRIDTYVNCSGTLKRQCW